MNAGGTEGAGGADPLDRYWDALVDESELTADEIRRQVSSDLEDSNFALLEDLNDMRRLLDDDATLSAANDETALHRIDASEGIAPGTRIDGYTVIGRLGRGGMGAVFKAHQHALGRQVALKLIRLGPMATEEELSRFQGESLAAASLNHPGIAAVYDSGYWEGFHYFSMELIDGPTISNLLHEGPIEPERAIKFVRQICDAVTHAHEKGILHRDLKPSNVLIDDRDKVHVVDFGLAKLFSEDGDAALTHSGAMVGTPSYMSPEQAKGESKRVTPRSDVYAIGAILYELVAGRAPFRAASPIETMRQVVYQEPASLRALNSEVSRDLETICLKCLEKDPDRRYASAMALVADLDSLTQGRPISARPIGLIGRTMRWCRANPSLAIASGLLVASLLVGTIVSATMWRISNNHANQAKSQLEVAQREAEKSAAVTKFFTQDVLGKADPNESDDREVKLKSVLDAAAETIEDQFQDEPTVEAAVRQALGNTYMSLGELKNAETHLQRAVELKEAEYGLGHPETISAMHRVGMFFYSNGEYQKAEQQFSELVSIATRALGADHAATLSAKGQLGHNIYWQQRYDEAEAIYLEVLAGESALGDEYLPAMVTRNNLAILYSAQNQFEKAESLLIENLNVQRRALGDTHLDTMTSLNNIGYMYMAQERFENAKPYFEEALASRRRVLGDHQHTAFSVYNLGLFFWQQDDLEKALPLLHEAYQMRVRVSGESHPLTQVAQRRLCDALMHVGKFEEALPYAQRCLGWSVENAQDNWRFPYSKALLGTALAGIGKLQEAEPLLLEGFTGVERQLEEVDHMIRDSVLDDIRIAIVRMYQTWGKPDELAKWSDGDATQETAPEDSDVKDSDILDTAPENSEP